VSPSHTTGLSDGCVIQTSYARSSICRNEGLLLGTGESRVSEFAVDSWNPPCEPSLPHIRPTRVRHADVVLHEQRFKRLSKPVGRPMSPARGVQRRTADQPIAVRFS
jgi:hypothetical protein